MKRKTILSCFAALLGVFLATGAFAQPWANTAPWHGTVSPYGTVPFQPAANNAPGLEQIGYAGSDTLFICLPHTANINLGVDVLSAYLPNTHGKWTWVYPVIVPIDTSNVFPTTGLTPGQTYIFKYTVTQTSCDLKIGDWLYAFVVVVPDLRNVSKDTTVCVGTGNLTIQGTQVTNSFSANLKQFIADWSVAATPTPGDVPLIFDISTSGNLTDTVKYTLTGPNLGKYTCDASFNYYYRVHVTDSIGKINDKVIYLCKDEAASRLNELASTYFGITITGNGTPPWSASPGGGLTSDMKINFAHFVSQTIPYSVVYNFPYSKSCKFNTADVFKGTIVLIDDTHDPDRGIDTAVFCKETPFENYLLTEHVTNAGIPFPNPSYWKFIGNDPAGGGTAPAPFTDGTAKGATTEDDEVYEDNFWTGIPYYFRYTLDPGSPYCWAGDSGLLVMSFNAPTGGTNDGAVEICQIDSADFNMNAYMSLPATTVWIAAPGTTVVNGVFKKPQTYGNYAFKYRVDAVAGACGGATTGTLWVHVTSNIAVSNPDVYYCVTTAPAKDNLFSLLKIAPAVGDPGHGTDGWDTAPAGQPYLTYLNTLTGEIDLAGLITGPYSAGQDTFTFTYLPDAGSSACVQGLMTVIIRLGTQMP